MARLRTTVRTVLYESDSAEPSEGEEEEEAWKPGDRGGPGSAPPSDEEEAEAARPGRRPARAGRAMTHAQLSAALLELAVACDTPTRVAAEAVTHAWLREGGLEGGPVVVGHAPGADQALGLRLPPELFADGSSAREVLPRLLRLLPPTTPVPVIDVASQTELPPVPLSAYLSYFLQPSRGGELLNVVSLSLAGTALEGVVCAPLAVRQADLVASAWPAARRAAQPEVQLYALASPAGCFTDFHVRRPDVRVTPPSRLTPAPSWTLAAPVCGTRCWRGARCSCSPPPPRTTCARTCAGPPPGGRRASSWATSWRGCSG